MLCTYHSGDARVPILRCSAFCRMLCSRTGGSAYSAPLQISLWCTISPYAFEGCIRLAQIGLPRTRATTGIQELTSPPEGLPTGCFHSSGIQDIHLSQATEFIGRKAFAQCQQLIAIDLSHTRVRIVQVQVFSHCRALAQITLPKHLTEIGAEAFEACVSLSTIALPPFVSSIG